MRQPLIYVIFKNPDIGSENLTVIGTVTYHSLSRFTSLILCCARSTKKTDRKYCENQSNNCPFHFCDYV